MNKLTGVSIPKHKSSIKSQQQLAEGKSKKMIGQQKRNEQLNTGEEKKLITE